VSDRVLRLHLAGDKSEERAGIELDDGIHVGRATRIGLDRALRDADRGNLVAAANLVALAEIPGAGRIEHRP
jgi:hypothetical protein